MSEKVKQTPLGLASGSGLTATVLGAIEALSAQHLDVLRHPDETGDYLREFMRGFARSAGANEALHPAVRAHLDRAGWVFTSRRKGKLQLRRHHPDRENFAPEYFNPGVPAVLLPIDLTAEISGPHEYDLMGALVPCPTPRQIDRTLPVNISVFARFFSTINALSVHLGSGIQVGVHFADGEIEVLPIQPLHSLLD